MIVQKTLSTEGCLQKNLKEECNLADTCRELCNLNPHGVNVIFRHCNTGYDNDAGTVIITVYNTYH